MGFIYYLLWICFEQAISDKLGKGKVKNITKEEALLSKDIEVSFGFICDTNCSVIQSYSPLALN